MATAAPVIAVALFCAAAQAQSLQLSQSSLKFSGYAGGDAAPPQSIIVTSTTQAPVRFTVSVGNSPWLSFKPPMAVTPARISVSVDPSALPAAGYQARIQISGPSDSASAPLAVPVTFTVDERQPALDVVPNSLRLDERDLDDTLFVRNAGGGDRLPFTVSVLGSSSWVYSITPSRGIVGPNAPAPVRIKVSPEGLDPGAYRAVNNAMIA